jgi:hypothetical protein
LLSLRKPSRSPWLYLAGAVVAIDAVALVSKTPTLTASFRRAVKHPTRRWPVLAAWVILTSHLVAGKP